MKLALPFALAGFILGCVAGVLFMKRRDAADSAPAPVVAGGGGAGASPSASAEERLHAAEKNAADAAAELAKAKEQIAKLEKRSPAKGEEPAKRVLTPEEAKAKAAELKALIPDLVAKKDGKALLKLMHELAALGEAGYLAAIEVSGIIGKDVESGKNELGLTRNEFWAAFTGPMVDVMVWGLGRGDEVSAGFRSGSVYGLAYGNPDLESGKLFLDILKTEKSPEVIRAIGDTLEGVVKPGMEGNLAALAPAYAENPRMLASLMDALVRLDSPESLSSLEQFTRSDNEKIRAEAEVAMIALKPPAAGLFITVTVPNSQADNVGIKRGDIITSYNGKTITSMSDLIDGTSGAAADSVVPITVNRHGEIITLQVKGGARIGIDGKDVKPK